MDNIDSTIFLNTKKYPYPPKMANTVFYRDNLLIKNIELNEFLETSPISDTKKTIDTQFSSKGNLIVQLLQVPADKSVDSQYIPVRYGDKVIFNIPDTTLMMVGDSDTNMMSWASHNYTIPTEMAYIIKPINDDKKIGDIVSYSDKFSIHINVYILGVDEQSHIETLYYDTYNQAKSKNKDVTFSFIPKIKGWYCDSIDGKCKDIPLEKMTVGKDGVGRYKNNIITRDPNCWGQCDKGVSGSVYTGLSSNKVYIAILVAICIIFAIIHMRRK